MRIFVLILLTAFLALAVLPHSAMAMPPAGHMDHAHVCADCVEARAGQDERTMEHPGCHHVTSISAATLPDNGALALTAVLAGDRYPVPAAETARAIWLGRDLPPPRL